MRRTLVLLLMVCLLPLRAWAGDAMALAHADAWHGAATAQATPAQPHAHCHGTEAAEAADTTHATHGGSHGASHGSGPDNGHAHDHASACTGCDICHSQVACDAAPVWLAALLPAPPLAHGPLRFASAPPLPRFKPPRA